MCDIFPEVPSCCFLISLRLGILFISVLSIMTGVTTLCILEQVNDASYDNLKNITEIRKPGEVISEISHIISSGITAMSYIFMFTGIVLFVASLSDQEGLVQIFVWLTFLGIVIGFLMVLMVGFECITKSTCMLSNMDWLSGACVLVLAVAYLCMWVYFITVANSYVLNV